MAWVALCLALSCAPDVSAAEVGGIFQWWPFLGPFHSVLLHFRISFVTMAFLVDLYYLWRPKVNVQPVIIEFNASFGPARSVTVPYEPSFERCAHHASGWYHGGSLAAFTKLYFKLHNPDARILAFEPNPFCFEMLKKNVEANGLKNVALVQAVCANSPGTTTFHVNPGFSPMSSAIGNRDEKQKTMPIEVRLVKLSDSITEDVDLLKLDIQGGEGEVFADLVAGGKLSRIHRMAIEYHLRYGTTEVKMSRFLKILEDSGYTYSRGVGIKAERRFMGVFQDVMIYAVKLGMEDRA